MNTNLNPELREETWQMFWWGSVALAIIGMLLFFGRECNREDTKHKQLRRESVSRCIDAGRDPLMCEKAMGGAGL